MKFSYMRSGVVVSICWNIFKKSRKEKNPKNGRQNAVPFSQYEMIYKGDDFVVIAKLFIWKIQHLLREENTKKRKGEKTSQIYRNNTVCESNKTRPIKFIANDEMMIRRWWLYYQ